jgi:large-conductance mechanosensitive channel
MYIHEQLQNENKIKNNNLDAKNPNNANNNITIKIIRKFLDTKTETVLTFAAAVAIATAFKDLVLSIITNIIHPLIVKLLILTRINNYVNISVLNASQDIVLNLSKFVINVFSFILMLVITYYLFNIIINSN